MERDLNGHTQFSDRCRRSIPEIRFVLYIRTKGVTKTNKLNVIFVGPDGLMGVVEGVFGVGIIGNMFHLHMHDYTVHYIYIYIFLDVDIIMYTYIYIFIVNMYFIFVYM